MLRKHASKFIVDLQERLLKASPTKPSVSEAKQKRGRRNVISSRLRTLPSRDLSARKRRSLPPQPVRQEPWIGAWLKEGDIVEAMFDDDPNEWYRGRIAKASANRMVWDVVYDDGDYQTGVCLDCVRPFVPYEVDETIEMRVSEDLFAPVKVLAVNEDTVDVLLIGTTKVYHNVETMELRRVTGTSHDPIPVTANVEINSMHIPGA